MPTLGVPELLVILVIVLLVFGAGKLPTVGRALGDSLRAFKKAQRELNEAVKEPHQRDPAEREADEVQREEKKRD
ncbi:MAG: twin-arginine translocase TatA/TatE family subunit [Pseudomonadota bacterium]